MNKASAKMIKLTFKVNGLKTLGDLPPQGRADVLNAAAGRVRSVVEEHFDSLPSRQFWKEAADDVVVAPQWTTREGKGETVRTRVEIRKRGVALRYYGGKVKARGNISELTGKPTKSILIPGKELRANGGDLFDIVGDPQRVHVVKTKAGRVLLVEEMGKDAPVRVLGQLVKSTTHKPNKKVMPTREKMETAARKGAEHILRRLDIQPKN